MRRHLIERLSAAAMIGEARDPGHPPSSGAAWPGRGDHDLNPDPAFRARRPLTPAAVLVPVVGHADGPMVLLTQRTDHLSDHPGQISFPGGRAEAGDRGPEETALRETAEELGLDPGRVDILGRLDLYETRTGFAITPVVGWIEPPLDPARDLVLDPFEVADVFEVPLAFILDPANHRRENRVFGGKPRSFHVLSFEERYIWGATAGMLMNLYEVLRKS